MSATSSSSTSASANGACPDPVEAPSVPGVYPDLVGALIPALSFDFQLLTFNFQPSNLQTFKRLRATSFAFISFAAPHHSFKSFSCNTYASPRKCCKQTTYGTAKLFRCNTYEKHGGVHPSSQKLLSFSWVRFVTSQSWLFRQTIAARFQARWPLCGRSPCQ